MFTADKLSDAGADYIFNSCPLASLLCPFGHFTCRFPPSAMAALHALLCSKNVTVSVKTVRRGLSFNPQEPCVFRIAYRTDGGVF